MSFTKEQKEKIIVDFWSKVPLKCPNDDAPLDCKPFKQSIDNYYFLINCPKCKEKFHFDRNSDPLKDKFRLWTTEEKEEIKNNLIYNKTAKCPVDNETIINYNQKTIVCIRCGNFVKM